VLQRRLIERHAEFTGSGVARRLLARWSETVPRFVKIMPKDYRRVLEATAKARAEGREPGFAELVGTVSG
jgi:glutamate synthase domain-containing protein 3